MLANMSHILRTPQTDIIRGPYVSVAAVEVPRMAAACSAKTRLRLPSLEDAPSEINLARQLLSPP